MGNRYETSMEARLAARVAELEAKVNRVCRWKQDHYWGDWENGCKEEHGSAGGPWDALHIAFCPKCGGKIEVTNG